MTRFAVWSAWLVVLPIVSGWMGRPSKFPRPFPGTTALSSPKGFEDAYDTLREIRSSKSRPLIHINEVEKFSPAVAARLKERVNFEVPRTPSTALFTFFSHPTAKFICTALLLCIVARCQLAVPISISDVAVGLGTALFWLVQEWFIHEKLLHSKHTWFGETVHRWHHEM